MTKRPSDKVHRSPGNGTTRPQDASIRAGKIARVGGNLHTLPFIRPSGNQDGPVRFEWTAVGQDGKSHDFYQVFRPGSEMKLPGPTAGRVTMALLSMSPGETGDNLTVETHLNQLARLCRLNLGGTTNRRLRRAIHRLMGVTIETNAFWDYTGKGYIDKSKIGLLSHYHVNDEGKRKLFKVQWTEAVTSLMSTWTEPVNLDHLFELDPCVARKLYQVSSLGIYQHGEMVEDLKLLCHGQLGISKSRKYPSQMKRSLKDPIKLLREKDLIDVRFEKDEESPSIKSDWLVRARPMKRMLEVSEEIPDLHSTGPSTSRVAA